MIMTQYKSAEGAGLGEVLTQITNFFNQYQVTGF